MQFLLAQSPESLSGGAGWVGAGLLGAVLGWLLLKHLPDKDKMFRDMIAEHNIQVATLHAECASERKAQHAEFSSSLSRISDRFSSDSDRSSASMREEMKSLRSALTTLCHAVDALSKTQGKPLEIDNG